MLELIPAVLEDLPLLFLITQSGMKSVNQHFEPEKKPYSDEQRYDKYVLEFGPLINQTFLLRYNSTLVGRLRLEETEDNIHLGGIQILDEYQSQGIGSQVITLIKNHNPNGPQN
jgi:GNAT superfamily N-acetyltransferase